MKEGFDIMEALFISTVIIGLSDIRVIGVTLFSEDLGMTFLKLFGLGVSISCLLCYFLRESLLEGIT